jgi:ankyrin repeat protein
MIEQKFGTKHLILKYLHSSGKIKKINSQKQLLKALEDGFSKIFVNKPGETNEFEIKPRGNSVGSEKSLEMVTQEHLRAAISSIEAGRFQELVQSVKLEKTLPHLADSSGKTLLHSAILAGDMKSVAFLVDCGADINAQDKFGWMAAHYAGKTPKSRLI